MFERHSCSARYTIIGILRELGLNARTAIHKLWKIAEL